MLYQPTSEEQFAKKVFWPYSAAFYLSYFLCHRCPNLQKDTYVFVLTRSYQEPTSGRSPPATENWHLFRPHICTPLLNLNLDFQLMARLKGIKLSTSWEEAVWQETCQSSKKLYAFFLLKTKPPTCGTHRPLENSKLHLHTRMVEREEGKRVQTKYMKK